jgi:mannose-6-phosphate isomerase-like protein (cupin superfamily)
LRDRLDSGFGALRRNGYQFGGRSKSDDRCNSAVDNPRIADRIEGGTDVNKSVEEAFVLRLGEGRAIDLGSFNMVVKASGDETNGAFSLLEASEPAGFGPPLHIHRDAAEVFYVLEGEYIIFIEGRQSSCSAGSFIFIPAGIKHGFRVGGVASRKLNLYAPAAMVGYFDELADAVQAGDMDPDALSRMALRYSMEVVGPVPEGYL